MGVMYRKFYWIHPMLEDPSIYLYEEKDGYVARVIEIYQDGTLKYASDFSEDGGAAFPDQPVPDDEDLEPDEFKWFEISAEDFEQSWQAALKQKETKSL